MLLVFACLFGFVVLLCFFKLWLKMLPTHTTSHQSDSLLYKSAEAFQPTFIWVFLVIKIIKEGEKTCTDRFVGQVSERKDGYTYSSSEWESKPGCRASESFFRHHLLCGTSRCGSLLDAAVLSASPSPGHSGLTARTPNSPTPRVHPLWNTDQFAGVGGLQHMVRLWAFYSERGDTCGAVRCAAAPSDPSSSVLQLSWGNAGSVAGLQRSSNGAKRARLKNLCRRVLVYRGHACKWPLYEPRRPSHTLI